MATKPFENRMPKYLAFKCFRYLSDWYSDYHSSECFRCITNDIEWHKQPIPTPIHPQSPPKMFITSFSICQSLSPPSSSWLIKLASFPLWNWPLNTLVILSITLMGHFKHNTPKQHSHNSICTRNTLALR